MRESEWKRRELRIKGSNVGLSSVEKYEGDPLSWALATVKGFALFSYPPESIVEMTEECNHKVGRKWIKDKTVLGTWMLSDLMHENVVES